MQLLTLFFRRQARDGACAILTRLVIRIGFLMLCFRVPLLGQSIHIDSLGENGRLSWHGTKVGSVAQIEWNSSLAQPGSTWTVVLTNVQVTNLTMTVEVSNTLSGFFRIYGTPANTIKIDQMPPGFLGDWYDTVTGFREWRFSNTSSTLRTANRYWTYESILDLGQGMYELTVSNNGSTRIYKFRNITSASMDYFWDGWGHWVTATR